MAEDNKATDKVRCDACQQEVSRQEVRKMTMRVCCNVVRMPLCKECWERFGKKMNLGKEETP